MLRELGKKKPTILFMIIFVVVYGVLMLLSRFPDESALFVPISSETRQVFPFNRLSGTAAAEDRTIYFRTLDGCLCSWDGNEVRTLIGDGEFNGQYLHAEKGVLFYSDMEQLGLIAYEPTSGISEVIVDYTELKDFSRVHKAFWWSDGEYYYFLNRQANSTSYAVWQVYLEPEAKNKYSNVRNKITRSELESVDKLHNICWLTGDYLVCTTALHLPDATEDNGNIVLYNYKTGEWKTILEYQDGVYDDPIGVLDDRLIVPYLDGQYIAVDIETGVNELYAQVDDPLVRLDSVGDEAVYAFRYGSGDGDAGQTMGFYRDGQFIEIGGVDGVLDEYSCRVGDMYLICGDAGTFSGCELVDLTENSTGDESISLFAVFSDGSVYRLQNCT